MTILIDIIPAESRKYVYAAFAAIGLVLGALQIAGAGDWVDTALGVYAFIGTATGLAAYANTTGVDPEDEEVSFIEAGR